MAVSEIDEVANGQTVERRQGGRGHRIDATPEQKDFIVRWYGRQTRGWLSDQTGLPITALNRAINELEDEGRIKKMGKGGWQKLRAAEGQHKNGGAARAALSAHGSATVWNSGERVAQPPQEGAHQHWRLSGDEALRNIPEVEREFGPVPDGWQREVCVTCGDVQLIQRYDPETHAEVTGRKKHEGAFPRVVALAQERALGPWPLTGALDGPPPPTQAEEIEGVEEETEPDVAWGQAPDFDPEHPEREHVAEPVRLTDEQALNQLENFLSQPVVCQDCGSIEGQDGTWRYVDGHYEHKCPNKHPQLGHYRIDTSTVNVQVVGDLPTTPEEWQPFVPALSEALKPPPPEPVRVRGWEEHTRTTREPLDITPHLPGAGPATNVSIQPGGEGDPDAGELRLAVEHMARLLADAEWENRELREQFERDQKTIRALEAELGRKQERVDALVDIIAGLHPVAVYRDGPAALGSGQVGRGERGL